MNIEKPKFKTRYGLKKKSCLLAAGEESKLLEEKRIFKNKIIAISFSSY